MTELVDRVRHRLVASPASLGDLDGAVRAETDGIVDEAVFAALRREVDRELTGAGALEPLLALAGVSDVLVNGADSVWVDVGRGVERTTVTFPDDAAIRRLAQRLAIGAGRRLDDAMPYVDAALPDGTRLHAILPPLCAHPTLSLRVLTRARLGLDAIADAGTARLLAAVVQARLAFVISGGTGAGKTTLLGAMLALVPASERVLVIEDAAEVALPAHGVRLVARAPNIEGAGAVGLRELVRQSLRMRPDRIVVGEFRGAEMVELLVALNTGHDGGAATLHANSAADVPARLMALGGLSGLPAAAVTSLAASALAVVIQLRRLRDGSRVIDEIGVFDRAGDSLSVYSAWSRTRGRGRAAARLADELAAREVDVPAVLR